ncbi:DUF4129 domain-containing protein [Halorarum salinum]|uniref:DUF4129 domain-containing protein n=1 Tax=Halorarum salinum TaxID=2743089 RepID=A0A7D5LDA4_9EURY|nr:DUF4129 domain-containing protein [Halobaculum salinum]QLG63868.1 DUF4129 domain-containing protein [Halobaculum salinum]
MVDRRTAATALLAVLAVLALGVAAATIDSATTSNAGGFGVGSTEDEAGIGERDAGEIEFGGNASAGGIELSFSTCVAFLTRPLVRLGLLAVVGLFFYAMYRTTGSKLLSGIFVGAASFPFAVVYVVLTVCNPAPLDPRFGASGAPTNETGLGAGAGDAGTNAAGEALSTPTALVGLLLVLALLGCVALLFVSTGDDEEEPADEEPDLPPPDRRAALGAAAGAAADRLEADSDLENEVYRAWSEMTGRLDVENPAAATPAEFAAAAVEAGMDRGDVTELTAVFEEVRYGGAEPTPEREARAVDALRHIEARYADGGSAAGDHA